MKKTFKYGTLILIVLTVWTNMEDPALFFWLLMFGACTGITFYLVCRLILWIQDCFEQAREDFHIF